MAFTQKYTIVQFIDNVADGYPYPYTEWPLHVTLADVFAVDWDASGLIDTCQPLVALHAQLVAALRAGNVQFNTPEYTLGGFTPHATVLHGKRLNKGDNVTFDALSVIDMFPGATPTGASCYRLFRLAEHGLGACYA